jgi:hypothetical protein
MDYKITQDLLKELFTYDPEGFLIWTSAANNQHAGKRAGYAKKDGYWHIDLFNNTVSRGAHRLVFLWHWGYLPKSIDHINRNPQDNRIENLREASPTQQNANKKVDPRNQTKMKGVEYESKRGTYRARIRVQGKRINIGRYKTAEEAHAAYCAEAQKLFGEYHFSG